MSINNLVGIRPTVGFVSRTGIAPLNSQRDTPGPVTRGVEVAIADWYAEWEALAPVDDDVLEATAESQADVTGMRVCEGLSWLPRLAP
jgi:amidase